MFPRRTSCNLQRRCLVRAGESCGQRQATREGEGMAPVKVKYIVSFTSEDPKHPVENLLREEGPRPWLCCPRDRSRPLKAELQLERACRISYIDVGNCGSAFLQIDVGRSSWPRDQPYRTLLPATALMAPADAKLDRNRSGVRMFKEGDFLASARAEKWDRVRLTCSQPFNRHTQFGLAFICVRTPLDPEDSTAEPAAASQVRACERPLGEGDTAAVFPGSQGLECLNWAL
ncbi:putative short transient receptor potential channel 2-like protein [Varanus komodoensis]|nr:putative short transient receptor potential channel 2-like protein [Varanus komodoensis]